VRAVLLCVLALLACKRLEPAEPPYLMVDELMARDLDELAGRELRTHGYVEAGSVRMQVIAQQTERTFVLQMRGKQLRVFTKGPVPDTFRDQAEVVALGRLIASREREVLAKQLGVKLEGAYVLEASELNAKCPSRYGENPQSARPKFE
jgi:cytochrome c-type biogenesis protein CcmE